MKTMKLLIITILSFHTALGQNNTIKDKVQTEIITNLELPGIQVVPIKDTKSDRLYELYIKLPEGYSEKGDFKYPVLYFTDALWYIEIVSGNAEFLLENTILVGISWEKDLKGDLAALGVHASRFRDFSIQPSSNPEAQAKYQFGQADNHLDFIRNDVIPYVENKYRTDPEIRSYFGYSAGAKFGAYTLLSQPSTFKNYILGSPTLGREGRDIPILSALQANEALNANVFISYGDLEGDTSPYTDEVIAMLKNKNDERLLLKHEVIGGTNETAFPMTVVRSMEWLSNYINNFPVPEGPYLGQKPPGLTPEVFAPGIVSTAHRELSAFFTPDMRELYFVRKIGSGRFSLITFKYENNQWHGSMVGPRVGRPIIAPDNKTMHLGKYYIERTATGWSEVKRLGPMFEQEWGIMRLSASNKGTYVFDDAKSNDVIRISEFKDGKREKPRLLNKNINTGKFTAHPFIAPDESYLIWDSERDDGYGDSDLYISFKQEDGSWGEAINLGAQINTGAWESNGYVTPNGKYLFFNRGVGPGNVDIFWVDAGIIEALKPK